MKQDSGHITRKVAVGYILLIVVAICSVAYIYRAIVRMAGTDETDPAVSRQKVYLITGALTRLYESETIGQLIGTDEKGFQRANRLLNTAQRNIDSLRILTTDPLRRAKIDTIDLLIERKRLNTKRLLDALRQASSASLYQSNIEKAIATQDTLTEDVRLEEQVIVSFDTVLVKKKPRGFFRRLAEVFVPSRQDSGVVINSSRQIQTDTLMWAFNPSDTIVSVLKSIQDSVADQRKELDRMLQIQVNNLRYDNGVITQKINQILRDIEQEEVDASLGRVREKQRLLNQASRLIALVAVGSLLIAVVFLFLIGRDLSRSQYYRRQLEKAKQYAENLLHIREKMMLAISHDIRAPLSSILGYIGLLGRLGLPERQQYYLKNMTGSAEHILGLVNDLLDFHRLESNRMEIHPVPFRVRPLFGEIYESFRPLAESKGLTFVFDWKAGADETRFYSGDTIRLRQVAGNLLSNALKFTAEGKVTLWVAVRNETETEGRLVFRVIDAGPGIPPAEQERIFGEFARLSSTEQEEGFGLGLAITRKLIDLMHGQLTLESFPGKGSTFTVNLVLPVAAAASDSLAGGGDGSPEEPRRTNDAFGGNGSCGNPHRESLCDCSGVSAGSVTEADPEKLSAGRRFPGTDNCGSSVASKLSEADDCVLPEGQFLPASGICCLLVDDDPFQLVLLHEILEHSGIRAVCCDCPREAARMLSEVAPDLVITDIQMPGFDGFSVLESIRRSGFSGSEKIPVIALSACVANEKEHYLKAGFTGFLNKPFTAGDLLELIGEQTGKSFRQPAAGTWNFASLTAFAGEDREASIRILRTFRDETQKSIAGFREALAAADRERAARLAHKLIPLMTLLGAAETADGLRKLEANDPDLSDDAWQGLLVQTVSQVMRIVEEVGKEMRNISPDGA